MDDQRSAQDVLHDERETDWLEHVEHGEVEARDRMMERGEPVAVVKCSVCGYHYRAATIGPDGVCIDHARCRRNQRTQAMYRAVKDSRRKAVS